MQPVLIYCYDAWCGWCYGFSTVIKRIDKEYRNRLSIEVLSGGMILPETPRHIDAMAGYISKAYKNVEELTGIRFGEDFLWHIFNPDKSDWYPHSEKPAIALCIVKELYPERQVEYAADLQYALNYEGRDLTDNEAYRHLLDKYNLDPVEFYEKLGSETYKEKAAYEFNLCKQLQVTGFPTVLIQTADLKFYLVGRGFTDYTTLSGRINQVLQDLTTQTQQA